jgi:Family of unknown function (DUF6069)
MSVSQDNGSSRPRVKASRLWSGGLATAIVAALVALVGVLACRWLFDISILAPRRAGAYGGAHTTRLVLAAMAAALIATALLHLLLLTTPRPLRFFGWIIGLSTAVAVLFPFSTSASLSRKIATAIVGLVIGIAIGSLLTGVAKRAVQRPGTGERRSGQGEYPSGRRRYTTWSRGDTTTRPSEPPA